MTQTKDQMRAEFEDAYWKSQYAGKCFDQQRMRAELFKKWPGGIDCYYLTAVESAFRGWQLAYQASQASQASAPQGVPANIRRAIQSALEGMSDALHVAGRDNKDEEDALDWLAASPQPAAQKIDDSALAAELRDLLLKASEAGYVVTVATVPKKPLAMGHFELVGVVRKSRALYQGWSAKAVGSKKDQPWQSKRTDFKTIKRIR